MQLLGESGRVDVTHGQRRLQAAQKDAGVEGAKQPEDAAENESTALPEVEEGDEEAECPETGDETEKKGEDETDAKVELVVVEEEERKDDDDGDKVASAAPSSGGEAAMEAISSTEGVYVREEDGDDTTGADVSVPGSTDAAADVTDTNNQQQQERQEEKEEDAKTAEATVAVETDETIAGAGTSDAAAEPVASVSEVSEDGSGHEENVQGPDTSCAIKSAEEGGDTGDDVGTGATSGENTVVS